MRLKLIHENRPGNGCGPSTRVINAETGQMIDRVVAVSFVRLSWDDPGLLTITVMDPDVEIVADGRIEADPCQYQ